MACGHTGDWSWCQQCLQQQEAEANEFREQREAALTARVEAQAARIEELEGALRGFMAATSDEAGWGKVDYMEGFGVYERIALCRNHASRALHGGDDDGE